MKNLKALFCFCSRLPPAVVCPRKAILFVETKNTKTRKKTVNTETRAAGNDSDPFNKFFNFRRQAEY